MGVKSTSRRFQQTARSPSDGDLLDVGTAGEADYFDHGLEADGELVAMHGRVAGGEEDDVVGHQVELRGEVSGGGGFAPGVDDGADLLIVLSLAVCFEASAVWRVMVFSCPFRGR